jgi:hypothetical protein
VAIVTITINILLLVLYRNKLWVAAKSAVQSLN